MGDLSLHFSRWEFECQCGCGKDDIAPELVRLVEDVRIHFNNPTTVNSGCRCPTWNKKEGGGVTSQHLKGLAADIAVKGVSPKEVADYLQAKGVGGLGRYRGFTHVDIRTGRKARWGRN